MTKENVFYHSDVFCTMVQRVARDYSLPDLGMRYEMVLGYAHEGGTRYVVSAIDLDELLDGAFDVIGEMESNT